MAGLHKADEWVDFVDELRVHGENGPLFSGIIVYNAQGQVNHEEGWFTPLNAQAKMNLFHATNASGSATSITMDKSTFHIVQNTFGNICAVGPHRKIGLITQCFKHGVIAVVFQWPNTLQTTFATMEAFGHRLRFG
ncbi:hypothetical protein THRCLA_21728 [Thraustotheca clavata]|uniref:Profilin n=1 Tax=Thraustotheca clavata TaxID=74557 RepID=A0A1V9ZQ97_9STRA|nr:hypothetical protein THRCLA_21728 [Thraustotheca clavata]